MTFTAVDAGGNVLGHIRVRQDDKRQLWVHSVYHDGFAWVGLHRHTYDIESHRATLSIPDIKMRAQVFADLLGEDPVAHNGPAAEGTTAPAPRRNVDDTEDTTTDPGVTRTRPDATSR